MSDETRLKYLRLSLAAFGLIFLLIYPMGFIWPSGWVWHGGQGSYYLQMICAVYFVLGIFLILASRRPAEHKSLIDFTIWSSVAHGTVMLLQAVGDGHEHGHLVADVPALYLVAGVLWFLQAPQTAARTA